MARRKGHNAQVDPFTAGEPTLPWDEPGSFEGLFSLEDDEAEPCAFDEGPYDGPTKAPDSYEAPDSRAVETDRPSKTDEARERKRRERAERAVERRARKAAPQDKQARPRAFGFVRAIFIFVILVNLLPLAIDIIGGVISDIISDSPTDTEAHYEDVDEPSYDEDQIDPEIDRSALDQDELACVEASESYLRAIMDQASPERAAVVDTLEQNMLDSVGCTCEDLGIDSSAYADWVLSNFSYRITSCYTRPDEGTASLYLYVWCPDTFDIVSTARRSIFNYLDERGVDAGHSMRPLSEEERARVGGMFTEAVQNAETDSESFLGFSLTLEGDAWVLDLEQARYQLSIPLGY